MLHRKISPSEIALSPVPAGLPRTIGAIYLRAHPRLRGLMVAGAIVLVVASFLVSGWRVSAQQSTTLRCRAEKTTVTVDGKVTLFLEVVDVADLYGYELTIKFNGSRIHFEDADTGKSGINWQVGDFLSPDFVVVNDIDNSTGQANLALTQLSPSQAISGTGELARATLTGVASGLVSFSFVDVVLSDPAGVAIPVTTQGCSIEVVGGSATETPTPTVTGTPSTPTPTVTPTPDGNNGTASISGSVFFDTNGNGRRTPDEPGIYAFVGIYRLGTSQQWADLTDGNGNFAFAHLPAGRYFVDIRVLDGKTYVFTTQSTHNISLEDGDSVPANFGLNFGEDRWNVFMPQVTLSQSEAVSSGTRSMMLVYLPTLSQATAPENPRFQMAEAQASFFQVTGH